MTTITEISTPVPSRKRPGTFAVDMDDFLAAIPTLIAEINAVIVEMRAAIYAATSGILEWNPLTPYSVKQRAWSPINFLTYERIVAGTTATDPSADAINWKFTGQVALDPAPKLGGDLDRNGYHIPGITELKFTGAGSGPAGAPVAINADGKVEAVSGASLVASVGTPVPSPQGYASASKSMAYDSATNTIVIAYQEENAPNYGYAVVGTIDGDTITYGTPVVIDNTGAMTFPTVCIHESSGKVVVIYHNAGNSVIYGIVGTINGDSISFGAKTSTGLSGAFDVKAAYSPVDEVIVIIQGYSVITAKIGVVTGDSIAFPGGATVESATGYAVAVTVDRSSGKIVACYGASSNIRSAVGTVSGTTISFGTPTPVGSTSAWNPITAVIDLSTGLAVVSWAHGSGNVYSAVGTITGTAISYGTPVSAYAGTSTGIASVYDSNREKVIVIFTGASAYTTAINGSPSGTTITFDTAEIIDSTSSQYPMACYSPISEKAIVDVYDSTSAVTETFTYQPPGVNSNVSKTIGLSTAAFADGEGVVVTTIGGVNAQQSGLIADELYFVDYAGSITRNPDTSKGYTILGRAISATEILLDGGLSQ